MEINMRYINYCFSFATNYRGQGTLLYSVGMGQKGGVKEIRNPQIGNGKIQGTSDGCDENHLVSSGPKQYYITINEIFLLKWLVLHTIFLKLRKYSYFPNHSISI